MGAPRGGTLRAWAELLRAPLLPSAAADVLAGWSLACTAAVGAAAHAEPALAAEAGARVCLTGWESLLRAVLCSTCLLAAGMAQNAAADAAEDRRLKPSRPIPRGDVSPAAAHATWIGLTAVALALAATLGAGMLRAAAGIAVLTALYHLGLKRRRLAGCLALGAARGLDLALGGLALRHVAGATTAGSGPTWATASGIDDIVLVALAYATYVTGAALHASTDDQPASAATRAWSAAGLLACVALLAGLAVFSLLGPPQAPGTSPWRLLAPLLPVLALARLVAAWRSAPAPVLTGVALSNVFLWDAAVVALGGTAASAAGALLVLALFAASRLLLRGFPPS